MAATVDFTSTTPGFISAAPTTLRDWAALFNAAALPVLASTSAVLEELRTAEDAVDAQMIADAISDDPLMTLKLLAHVAQLRRWRGGIDRDRSGGGSAGAAGGAADSSSWLEGGEIETATEALVMLGISPFFRAFGLQPTVESVLAGNPAARRGFAEVLQRARRAARFATGFAVHGMDPDVAVLHEAALLHDFADLLLWLRAPALALLLQHRQQADPGLRSGVAQRELLHIALPELEYALMQEWHLPRLLLQITDAGAPAHVHALNAQMRKVQLAIRISRHSALGWDNPALPDDMRELAALLKLSPDSALRLLREIDSD